MTDFDDAIKARESKCVGCRGEVMLRAHLRKRYALVYSWRELCANLLAYCKAARVSPEWCTTQTEISKMRTIGKARIILCTIASTSGFLRECGGMFDGNMQVHIIIVDEAGCTTESAMALLFRLRPRNLILIGDHKQLPPTTNVPLRMLAATGHTRSLLERCVVASGEVKQLQEQ